VGTAGVVTRWGKLTGRAADDVTREGSVPWSWFVTCWVACSVAGG